MVRIEQALTITIAVLVTAFATSCNGPGSNRGSNSSPARASVSNANKPAPVAIPVPSPAGGVIEVTSAPAGAVVVLIREEEGGAGNPQRKGVTPVTISGVDPGKYSVTLEKSGFRYFQKEIEVKQNKTVRVAASLKRG